jgi:hypothetical protein
MGKELNKNLLAIQQELKAPKGQYNNFGKYKYRSCEDILEAVKPLLQKYSCTLVISDDILMLGSRFYVKATVTLSNGEEDIITTAFAREEEEKKGSDSSQITGAASSYARKYALNGLFCIDDTKDSDTTNTGQETSERDKAIKEAKSAKTMKELESVWNKYTSLKTDAAFKSLIKELKKKFE